MDNRTVISVWDTVSAAWDKVYGAKGTIWAAMGILILIMIGFGILNAIASHISSAFAGVTTFIMQIVQVLLTYGLYYIGIKRAADEPIKYDMMFYTFSWNIAWRIFVLVFLIGFVIYLPSIILFIVPHILTASMGVDPATGEPSHFLHMITWICSGLAVIWIILAAVRIMLALPYVLYEVRNPWEAIKLSWHATKGNFFPLLGLIILASLIVVISAIPLGIGLIWTIPWGLVLIGVIFQRLKGNASAVPSVKA